MPILSKLRSLIALSTPMQTDVAAPMPMPSHDIGVVGLVKRLVDHTASGTARAAQPVSAIGDVLAIESMTVQDGIVILRKPNA